LGSTVAELQERMSSAEFSEWIEFYKLEPFGRDAEYEGHALTAAMVQWRSLGKDEKPVKVEDLMPKEPTPAKPQTSAQMKQFASMMAIAGMGTIEDKY
jgi:hypothetical protein